MRKTLTRLFGVALVLGALAAVAVSQVQTTTVKKVQTVQNPDGTYTIVEYPVGKETTVILNPVGITGATARGTIIRDDNGTTIKLNLASLPADLAGLNIYAVDPTGAVTMLGPVEIANGVGTFTTTTPLNKFMLIASADENLAAYDPNTKIIFRSAVPSGFTVIPLGGNTAVGEAVGAVAAPVGTVVAPVGTVASPVETVVAPGDYAV